MRASFLSPKSPPFLSQSLDIRYPAPKKNPGLSFPAGLSAPNQDTGTA